MEKIFEKLVYKLKRKYRNVIDKAIKDLFNKNL